MLQMTSFANKDEIVKFLFLILNINERVKDQLIEKMKPSDTLTDILQLAKIVESMVQMETLSKQILPNVGKLNTTTEVHAVQKHHHSKTNVSNQILEVPVVGNHPAGIKVERSMVIMVVPTFPKQCPVYGKECFKCKKKNHFSKLCWSSEKKPGIGVGNPKHFSRKDVHEVENQSLNMTLILWSLKESQFSTAVFNLRKDSLSSQNIMFDEISESKKLH